jgi:ATP-dependent exoDNAse (exonuclease V) alpha subunit
MSTTLVLSEQQALSFVLDFMKNSTNGESFVVSGNRDGLLGTRNLNATIKKTLYPQKPGNPSHPDANGDLVTPGDRITFLRNDPQFGIVNGDCVRVTHISENFLTVRIASGVKVTISLATVPFALAYAMSYHRWQGQHADSALFIGQDAATISANFTPDFLSRMASQAPRNVTFLRQNADGGFIFQQFA